MGPVDAGLSDEGLGLTGRHRRCRIGLGLCSSDLHGRPPARPGDFLGEYRPRAMYLRLFVLARARDVAKGLDRLLRRMQVHRVNRGDADSPTDQIQPALRIGLNERLELAAPDGEKIIQRAASHEFAGRRLSI
jgi:hypothetical protein